VAFAQLDPEHVYHSVDCGFKANFWVEVVDIRQNLPERDRSELVSRDFIVDHEFVRVYIVVSPQSSGLYQVLALEDLVGGLVGVEYAYASIAVAFELFVYVVKDREERRRPGRKLIEVI
jgi:hypothetical protein